MKKLFYLLGLLWCCAYLLPLSAKAGSDFKDPFISGISPDTVNCNIYPKFSWVRDSMNCKKIRFINQSTPISPNVHFVWKFGDGTSSNDINPTHEYAQEGVYNVCLIMESGTNCRKEFCMQVEVRCQVACNLQAKFEFRKDTLNPLKVFFINQTVVPPAGAQYLWTFGDGTSSTERNPVHTYSAPGTYTVCLKVVVSTACASSVCKQVILQVTPPPPACNVTAKFTHWIDSSRFFKVWFRNLSQPIQNIWRTSWSYGDGTSSQDFNSFHEYQQPGKYLVCLKVQSLNGCISTYCDTVVIRRNDSCENRSDFTWEVSPNNPLEYRFKPKYLNAAWQYLWKFGDSTSSTAMAPAHKFPKAGVYRVCLRVTTANNCVSTTCKEVRVGLNGREITSTNIPVYPNPASNMVKLEVKLESAVMMHLRVIDGTGVPKMEMRTQGRTGNNYISLPVEKLANGIYVVEIRYADQVKLAKFQKS